MSKKQSPSDQSGTHSPNFRKSTEQRFQLESLEKRELMAADLLSSLSPEPVFAESAEIAEGEADTAPVARNDAFETTQGQKLVVAEQLFAKTFDLRSEEMKTPFYSQNASMLRESFSPNVYYWQPSSLNQWAEVTYKVEVPFEIDHVDMPGLGAHHLPYMSVYNGNADVNFDSGARGEVQVSVDNQNWFTLYESTPEGGRQAPNDINDIVAGHDTFYFKGRMYATRHLGCCGLSQFLRSSPERDSFPVLKIHGVAGVLQNDADPNGDRLTADLLRQPSNGQLVLNEDGFFEYTPNSGFAGLDTFSYTASDGNEKSNPATVAINVKGTNNPPTLDNIADPAPINEDAARQSVRITGISSGDTRREDLELHVSTDNPQLLTNLEVNYNQGDDFAIVSYTPAADAFGKAEVTVTVEDDGTDCKLSTRGDNLKTSQSFTVVVNPVNDLPLIDSDVIQVTIEEDSQSDLIPFTISDVETPADRLEILIESGDPVAIPPENIVITGEGNQRFVQITPDPDQHGHTHIVLTVMDEEGALAQHRIQVDISCINDAPVATDDQYSVDRDSRLIVPSRLYREVGLGVTAEHWTSVGNNENGNDFSTHTESGVIGGRFTRSAHKRILADTDLSTVLSFDQPFSAAGVLEIGDINVPDFGNGMMIGHFDDGSAAEVDEVRDGPVEIGIGFTDNSQGNRIFWYGGIMDHGGLMMPATGMTEITPNSTHLWSYEWDPAGGDGNGIFKATLDGVSHIIELNEEQRKQLDQTELNAFGFAGNAASHPNGGMYADIYMKHASYTSGQQKGVLENDYDVDLDPLESKLVSQPKHGTLELNKDGSFIYTPDEGYHGNDSFSYTAYDGEASSNVAVVSIEVICTNTPPVAVDDAFQIDNKSILQGQNLLENDNDVDGDTLTAKVISNVEHGTVEILDDGTFTYRPDPGFFGTDSFTYVANDGHEDSNVAVVTIEVSDANDAPFFVYEELSTNPDLEGAIQWKAVDGGNNHWYKLVMDPEQDWEQAQAKAEAMGGYLATLTSAEEDAFVLENLLQPSSQWSSTVGPWLGGFQNTNSPDYSEPAGGWEWVTGEPMEFTNWRPGEPNNGPSSITDENYMHYYYVNSPNPAWNDIDNPANDPPTPGFILELEAPSTPIQVTRSQQAFYTDFNDGIPAEFSGYTNLESVQGFSGLGHEGNQFSGQFLRNATPDGPTHQNPGQIQQASVLTLKDLPEHTHVDINFLLGVIDSWDGKESAISQEDLFNVEVDGKPVFSHHLSELPGSDSREQSYEPLPHEILAQEQQLGFSTSGGFFDSAYDLSTDHSLNHIAHTSDTLTVRWYANGSGWQGGDDESWAIDNVEVILKGIPENNVSNVISIFEFCEIDNPGNSIAEYVEHHIEDLDIDAVEGIAIIGTTHFEDGSWQYSLDNKDNWVTLDDVSDLNALLLRPEDHLRFVPNHQCSDWGSVEYRAWDQTGGTAGDYGQYTTINETGDNSPFSDTTAISVVTISLPHHHDENELVADRFEILEDSGMTTLDVLANDKIISGKITNITTSGLGSQVAISDDGLTVTYTPNENVYGQDTLEYTVTSEDATGKDHEWVAGDIYNGDDSRALHSIDLDSDGDLDLITGSYSHDRLAVRMNDGEGHFSSPTYYDSLKTTANGLAAADFDGDGVDDFIVVGERQSGKISLHINNGDGTLAAKQEYQFSPTGGWPHSIVAADLTKDGLPNVAIIDSYRDQIYVLEYNRDLAEFSILHQQTISDAPSQLAVGDIDADGDLDLAVGYSGGGIDKIDFLIYDNNGSFIVDGGVNNLETVNALEFGDIDFDGDDDLIVNVVLEQQKTLIYKYDQMSNNYTLAQELNLAADTNHNDLTLSDYDQDGDLDLFVLQGESSQTNIYRNVDGKFVHYTDLIAGTLPVNMGMVDVDGDGDPDPVIIHKQTDRFHAASNDIHVFLNQSENSTSGITQTFEVIVTPVNDAPTLDPFTNDNSIILAHNGDAIFSTSTNGPVFSEVFDIPDNAGTTYGIDVHQDSGRLFAYSFEGHSPTQLHSVSVDGSGYELHTASLGAIGDALGINQETGEIYVAPHTLVIGQPGSAPGGMQLVSGDGTSVETLSPRPYYVTDIEVDHRHGHVYYSGHQGFTGIRRMDLDGSNDIQITTHAYNGFMALDIDREKIYYTRDIYHDRSQHARSIYQVDLDGSNQELLLENIGPRIQDIDLSGNTLYINRHGAEAGILAYDLETKALSTVSNTSDIEGFASEIAIYKQGGNARLVIPEDSPEQTVSLTNITAGPNESQPLSVLAESDNTGLISEIHVSYDSPGSVGELHFTPAANQHGQATISVTVEDGGLDNDLSTVGDNLTTTETFEVIVTPDNDTPLANNDAYTVWEDSHSNMLDVLTNDTHSSDAGETFLITEIDAANVLGDLEIVADGEQISYTPQPNFSGIETFTYTITDNEGSRATASVSIEVKETNDAPVAVDDTFEVNEDSVNNTLDVLANDHDGDDPGDSIRILDVNHQQVTIAEDGLSLNYTPESDFHGQLEFSYSIVDQGGDTSSANVTLTVNNVGDAPVAIDDHYQFLQTDDIIVLGLTQNDSAGPDANSSIQIIDISNTDSGNDVTIGQDGQSVTYHNYNSISGLDRFTYTIENQDGLRDSATVTLELERVNHDPDARDDYFTITDGTQNQTLDVLANDSTMPDTGEVLTITEVHNDSDSLVEISSDGKTLLFSTLETGDASQKQFTYTISDGNGGVAEANVTVEIDVVIEPPSDDLGDGLQETYSALELDDNGYALLDVLKNERLAPGYFNEPMELVSIEYNGDGSAVINTDQNAILYHPGDDLVTTESITYTFTDSIHSHYQATATIQIAEHSQQDDMVQFMPVIYETGTNNIIYEIDVDQPFDIAVTVQDIRPEIMDHYAGVFAAYMDVLYTSEAIELDTDSLQYSAQYGNAIAGDLDSLGCIDEVGAMQAGFSPLGPDALELFRITATGIDVGITEIQTNPADIDLVSDTLVFEPPSALLDTQIDYATATLEILTPDPYGHLDINDDGQVTPIDALHLVNDLNFNGARPLNLDAEMLEAEGEVIGAGHRARHLDVNRDNYISPLDALAIINHLNAPPAMAEGEGPILTDMGLRQDQIAQTDILSNDIVATESIQLQYNADHQREVWSQQVESVFESFELQQVDTEDDLIELISKKD